MPMKGYYEVNPMEHLKSIFEQIQSIEHLFYSDNNHEKEAHFRLGILYGFLQQNLTDEKDSESNNEDEELSLLDKAKKAVRQHNSTSAAFLQRKFKLNNPAVSVLLRQLEAEGVISPGSEGQTRKVLK